MPQILSLAEAERNFSEIISQVSDQRQSFVLTRDNVAVAQLMPISKTLTGAELARRWPERPLLTPEEAAVWEEELAELRMSVGPSAQEPNDSQSTSSHSE